MLGQEKTHSITALSKCLEGMRTSIKRKSLIAGLVDNWSNLVGEKLSQNCCPLRIQQGILFIGAEHPQWRQALIYNRMKLISTIKSSGYKIKDIKIQQYYPPKNKNKIEDQKSIWERHPSRFDVHGIAKCNSCGSPAPAGEMALWGNCGFCRRSNLQRKE